MTFKRFLVYVVVFLCLLSIYYDLSGRYKPQQVAPIESTSKQQIVTMNAVPMVVKPGQSVLSITEQINADVEYLDIKQILNDFIKLNPGVDPLNIQINQTYYFPLY